MESAAGTTPRRVATAVVLAAILPAWAHGLGAITQNLSTSELPLVWPLSLLAIGGAVVVALLSLSRGGRTAVATGIGIALIGMGALHLVEPGEWARALPLVVLFPLASRLSPWLFARLPEELDARYGSWSLASVLVVLAALFSVLQCARLTSFLADQEKGWFVVNSDPSFTSHKCIGAYLYAAEMNARGVENIYDNNLYEAWNEEAETETELVRLPLPDPYVYPPQFLLLPHLAIHLTKDMLIVEQIFSALQITLLWCVGIALALHVGGATGLRALVLFPLIAGSPSIMSSFVGGQFHAATIILAIGGMLALARKRMAFGGGLLGFAIVAKLFPLLLLVLLAVQRKWKAIGWTLGAIAVYSVLALVFIETQAFEMFFTYHLPRLSDGSATAFETVMPDLPGPVYLLAGLKGSYAGMLYKLQVLGVIDLPVKTAITIGKAVGASTVLVALFAITRNEKSRENEAIGWLALVGLASMAGTVAWVNIGVVQSLWLASFLAVRFRGSLPLQAFLAVVWVTGFLMLGTQPLGTWNPMVLMLWLSLLTALVMPATFLAALFLRQDVRPAPRSV